MISELKKANRYDEVIATLNKIINDTRTSYPLYIPYVDKTLMTVWDVNGETVRIQAKILLELINSDSNENISDDFKQLGAYVRSKCDILLRNYAIAILHKEKPEKDVDDIIPWGIIHALILSRSLKKYQYMMTIPKAWYKDTVS